MGYINRVSTLGRVKQEVFEESNGQWDEIVELKDIKAIDAYTLSIGDTEYPLTPNATSQLSNRLGIPENYLHKCSKELSRQNIQYWLNLEGELRDSLLIRHSNKGEIRALLTERYKPFDNHKVISELYKMGFNDDTKVTFGMDKDWLNLQVLTSTESIGNDDDYHGGVSIQNSETGRTSFGIATYVLRIVCTNGMINSVATKQQKFWHTNKDLIKHIDEVFWAANDSVSMTMEQIEKAKERPLLNADSLMKNFSKKFLLVALKKML